MRDRLSTKILSNGATRYGVYDETGNLLRYEYIKLEDEPTVEGDLFSKANMLPDSIPAALGLKMGNPQVKDALNVLANIGNVHVWKRVQTYADPVPEVPAGYTLGAVEENVVLASRSTTVSTNGTFYYYYGDSVTVKNDGTVNAPSSDSWATIGRNVSATTLKSGPLFVKGSSSYISSGSGYQDADVTNEATKVFYIPSGGTLSVTVDSNAKMCYVVATKYQPVTGYPYTPAIPAGTHVDYLTSTDRNAYPDQSAEGGQDAYYTLGDVVSGSFYIGSFFAGSNSAVQYMVSDTPFVDESGSVSISNGTTVTFSNSLGDPGTESDAIAKVKALFAGKYVMRTNDPETDSSTMYYTLLPKNEVVYIPDDISVSVLTTITGSPNSMALSKYQPVIGHAAIPASTVITYLGQLGEPGAKIEVGSYVGTGTYGSSNPNSLTFGFKPKIVELLFRTSTNVGGNYLKYEDLTGNGFNKSQNFMVADRLTTNYAQGEGFGYNSYSSYGKKSPDGKTFYWYSSNAGYQCNSSGYVYYYIAIG